MITACSAGRACAFAWLLCCADARAGPRTEHDIKAAYLLNILRLCERKSSPGTGTDLTLCLVAAGAIEKPMRELEQSPIRGRKLKIRTVEQLDLRGCEALFFGRSAGYEPLLAKAGKMGILTIGNDHEFLSMSGMIALVVENRRIVLEVNQSATRDGEWKLSSHLLEAARLSVGGAP
jgi:hypothetical protein